MNMTITTKLDALLKFIYISEEFKNRTIFGLDNILGILLPADKILDAFVQDKDFISPCPEIKTSTELIEALNKLAKDGYLNKPYNADGNGTYFHTTLEGRFFAENGGYANAHETEILENGTQRQNLKRQIHRDNLLIGGSWIAGLGTLILALVEIYKLCYPPSH